MAGLACADLLAANGHSVRLFDKGRAAGGRMSTRRVRTSSGEAGFDHGAQYFTVRDQDFADLVCVWEENGIAARWPAAGPDAWVGTPGMNAPVKAMAQAYDVQFGKPVTGIERSGRNRWQVAVDGQSQGPFDAVVLALPAEQAAALLSLHDFELGCRALSARSLPCWTAMFAFDERLDLADDPIRDAGNLVWAVRNSAKPCREGPEAWVLQATPDWSRQNLERPAEEIASELLEMLADLAGRRLPETSVGIAHRWRFAMSSATGDGALWNDALGLGACGDWLLGPRVECAWLSGRSMARAILGIEDARECQQAAAAE